jgi:hypothetical protein
MALLRARKSELRSYFSCLIFEVGMAGPRLRRNEIGLAQKEIS